MKPYLRSSLVASAIVLALVILSPFSDTARSIVAPPPIDPIPVDPGKRIVPHFAVDNFHVDEALYELTEVSHVPIEVDRTSLYEMRENPHARVTLECDDWPVDLILRSIFNQTCYGHRLEWVPRDGGLLVGRIGIAFRPMIARVYDVTDIVESRIAWNLGLPQCPPAPPGMVFLFTGSPRWTESLSREDLTDEIRRILLNRIDSAFSSDVDEPRATVVGTRIILVDTAEGHQAVATLLQQLRDACEQRRSPTP